MLKSFSILIMPLLITLMQPAPDLSMITGEHRSWKSIYARCMGILLGNRADTKVLTFHDDRNGVEALFEIGKH